ncbi:DUF4157 domain-containing protein [Rheinheimera muenzenbergensis]|uniref:DUF4157 domain-containing protein n=1 Tax=Rheinheimera muenzenbergensis TaxID=1193628 RepID=A0ABU8C166_9GAMM
MTNTHADKTQKNKSQSVANGINQMQSVGESTFQFVDNRTETIAQKKLQEMANISRQTKQVAQLQAVAGKHSVQQQPFIQKKNNNTGLPDTLKTGIENLSGYSMDDVKVHYHSDKPAQLQAHAFAQGTDIHIASGQEKHLPHETWHVVQQKQGRVKPTSQLKQKVNINDDISLENEADIMGAMAVSQRPQKPSNLVQAQPAAVVQAVFKDSADLRKERFMQLAQETYGIAEQQAQILYDHSGGNTLDPVTKLRTSSDQEETRALARDFVDKGTRGEHDDIVFYADIKFRNLAGLNAAKGHAGADDVFGKMSKLVDDSLNVLRGRYQVQGYRHEGSRFGFMVIGNKATLTKELIEAELKKAESEWKAKKGEMDIADIANPKRPEQKGVDMGFSVFEMKGSKAKAAEAVDSGAARLPADAGVSSKTAHDFQGDAPGTFKGAADARDDDFKLKGAELGLEAEQIAELYKIAGRSEKEALTGFDAAGDRIATLVKAKDYFNENYPSVLAGYVEVDVRNLGGLNDNLTRGDSDNVFRFMSDTTDKHMRSLKADVISFRHGGDEFSFVVVGQLATITIQNVETVLTEAETAVAAYVTHKKIRQQQGQDVTIDGVEQAEISLLNEHKLPEKFKEPFRQKNIMRKDGEIETNTENKLWRVIGQETYWLIANRDTHFSVYNIPRELTLSEILHSKNTEEKPRHPGTGIVWGTSAILREDTSPIDVVARADLQVEHKKK